jgi:hypothetical protein
MADNPTVGQVYAMNMAATGGVPAQLSMGRDKITMARSAQDYDLRQQQLSQAMQLAQMRDAIAREQMAQGQRQFDANLGLQKQGMGLRREQMGMQNQMAQANLDLKKQQEQRLQQEFQWEQDEKQLEIDAEEAYGKAVRALQFTEDEFAQSPIGQALLSADIPDRVRGQLWKENFELWADNSMQSTDLPAVLQTAQELDELTDIMATAERGSPEYERARSRYNNIMRAGKMLDKGREIGEGGDVELMGGQAQATLEESAAEDLLVPNQAGTGFESAPGVDESFANRDAMAAKEAQQSKEDVIISNMEPKELEKLRSEAMVSYTRSMNQAPELDGMVMDLVALAPLAAYSGPQKAFNAFAKTAGFDDIPDSAAALTKYGVVVKANILPKLKAMLGSQFAKEEGAWLLSTLGDDTMHPEQKVAAIEGRVDAWAREIMSNARTAGEEVPSFQEIFPSFYSRPGATLPFQGPGMIEPAGGGGLGIPDDIAEIMSRHGGR